MAEIATSSAAIDLGAKKNAYRRNGVQEYLVWQTFENRFSWFRLQTEEFVLIEPDADGIIRSMPNISQQKKFLIVSIIKIARKLFLEV